MASFTNPGRSLLTTLRQIRGHVLPRTGLLRVQPERIDFPLVKIPNDATEYINVYNDGDATLTVSAVAVTILEAPAGSRLGFESGRGWSVPAQVASGGCAQIPIRFHPDQPGGYKGSVTITCRLNTLRSPSIAVQSTVDLRGFGL